LKREAAGTQSDVRYLLADMINELLRAVIPVKAGISFTISPSDVVVLSVIPSKAGISDKPGGVNGYFEFRVTPKRNVIR